MKLYEYYDSALSLAARVPYPLPLRMVLPLVDPTHAIGDKSITLTLGGASTVIGGSSGNTLVFKVASSGFKNPQSSSVTFDLKVTGHSGSLQRGMVGVMC